MNDPKILNLLDAQDRSGGCVDFPALLKKKMKYRFERMWEARGSLCSFLVDLKEPSVSYISV